VQSLARNLGLTHFVDKSYIELHHLLSSSSVASSGDSTQTGKQNSTLNNFLGTAKL
jgi:hypothetical protein